MSDYVEDETHLHSNHPQRRTFLRRFRASEPLSRYADTPLSSQDRPTAGLSGTIREGRSQRHLRRIASVPNSVSTLCAQVSEGALAAAVGVSWSPYNDYANSPPLSLTSHVPFTVRSPLPPPSLSTEPWANFPRTLSGGGFGVGSSWCVLTTATTHYDGLHESLMYGSSSGPTFQRIMFAAQSQPASLDESASNDQGKVQQLLHPLTVPPPYLPSSINDSTCATDLPSLVDSGMSNHLLQDVRVMCSTDNDGGYELLNVVQENQEVTDAVSVPNSQDAVRSCAPSSAALPSIHAPPSQGLPVMTGTSTFRNNDPNKEGAASSRESVYESSEWFGEESTGFSEMTEAAFSTKRWVNRATRRGPHSFSETSMSLLRECKNFSRDDNLSPVSDQYSPLSVPCTQIHCGHRGNQPESRAVAGTSDQPKVIAGASHTVMSPLSSQLSAASNSGAMAKTASPKHLQSSSTLSSSWAWKDDDRTQWTRISLLTPTQQQSRSESRNASAVSEDGEPSSPPSSLRQPSSLWCSPLGSQSSKRQRAASLSHVPCKKHLIRVAAGISISSESEECEDTVVIVAAGSERKASTTISPICASAATCEYASGHVVGSVEDVMMEESPIHAQATLFRSLSADSTSSGFTIIDPPSPDVHTSTPATRRNTSKPSQPTSLPNTNGDDLNALQPAEFDILWSSADSAGFITVERVRFSGEDLPLESSQNSKGDRNRATDSEDNGEKNHHRSRTCDTVHDAADEPRVPSSPRVSHTTTRVREKARRAHSWLQWYLPPTASDGCGCFLCNHSRPQLLVSYLLDVLVSPPESLMHLMFPHMDFLFSEVESYCTRIRCGGRRTLVDMFPLLPVHYLACP